MDVFFQFKNGQNRNSHKIGAYQVTADKGVYKTTDTGIISAILNSELFKRGEITLVSDPEVVNDYLSGKEPDYLTAELLNTLPDECVVELALLFKAKNYKYPALARAEILNSPITNQAKEIIDHYSVAVTEDGVDIIEKGLADGLITKHRHWYTFHPSIDAKKTVDVDEVKQVLYNYYNSVRQEETV